MVNLNDGFGLWCQVGSLEGNIYHQSEYVQSGQFAFEAVENGDYMACFWVGHQKPQVTLTIDLDWRTGVAAKDWSNVAKKSHIDVSECLYGIKDVYLLNTFLHKTIDIMMDVE